VDTSVFTSFFIGVLTNSEKVKSRLETPHFEILLRASYGMDRTQLEVYNENIRMGRWRSKPFDRDDPLKRVSAGATLGGTM
jgi:DNA ligase-4